MAIQHDEDTQNGTQAQDNASQAPLGGGATLGGATGGARAFRQNAPWFGSARHSEQLNQVAAHVNEWLKGVGAEGLIVTTVDASVNKLGMGAVCLSYPFETSGGEHLLFTYTILIEATKIPGLDNDREYMWQQQRLAVPTVPTDVFNDRYLAKVGTLVLGRAQKGYKFVHAGFTMIPTEVNTENKSQVAMIAQMGTEAIGTIIEVVTGDAVREVQTIKELIQGKTLQVKLDYEPAPHKSATGMPIRSDLAVTVTGREIVDQNDPFGTNSHAYLTTHGFVDVAFFAIEDSERYQLAMNPALQAQRYQAQYVITDIQSHDEVWSIETLLFALFNTLHLADQNNWMATFHPRHGSVGQMRDVGMLPVDLEPINGTPQAPIDTKSAAFDDNQFWRLMGMLFRPGLGIAIDIDDAGSLGWIGSIFKQASVIGSKEYNAIVMAANRFTDGHFPLNFNQPIIRNDGRRTLLGYYTDRNNNEQDVRRWADYLTLLTKFGTTELGMVREFDASTTPLSNEPAEVRAVKQKQIIEKAIGSNVRYTSAANRHSIADVFLTTFGLACTNANLRIGSSNTIYHNFGGVGRRTSSGFNGFVTAGNNGFFQQNVQQGGQNFFGNTPNAGTAWSLGQ